MSDKKALRIAAVDAGTNTILMLIADVAEDGSINIIHDEHAIARLGKSTDATGAISADAIERGCDILRRYAAIANELGVEIQVGVGTSAIRDATNSTEVLAALSSAYGASIYRISGDEEAALCFRGTCDNNEEAAVLDIGGGSTELIIGKGDEVLYRKSLNIGAVRMTERYFGSLPPRSEEITAARNSIQQQIQAFVPLAPNIPLYAVAGTPTTLAAVAQGIREFDWFRVDGFCLEEEGVASLSATLNSLSHEELISIPGVHPERADILPMGTLILHEFLRQQQRKSCIVSAKGLRFGVLKAAANLARRR